MGNKFSKEDLESFFNSFDPQFVEEHNKKILAAQEHEFRSFQKYLEKNECYLCGFNLNDFNSEKFCLHWFTYPKGIKKKHFQKALKNPHFGYTNIDAYFRWLANSEKFIGNINDLKSETSSNSFLEVTYKFKNIQWAFSVGETDFEGHVGANFGSEPHYHLEMKVDDRIFLKFNDFHLPFTDEDLFKIEASKQIPDRVITKNPFDLGANFLEDEKNIEMINQLSEVTSDHDKATMRYQSFFIADENNPITGQMLEEAIEESERTKRLIGVILNEKLQNVRGGIIISPGDGIPKMSKRSGKN